MLTGKYKSPDKRPRESRYGADKNWGDIYVTDRNIAIAGEVEKTAAEIGRSASQVAIAWLLKKSPVMMPIPGTSKVKHLEENASAALIKLDDALMEELDRLSKNAHAEAG